MTHIPRIGIGGPVGSGKSMLIECLVPILAEIGYSISIISNDVISKEDADRIRKNLATERGLLPENMVIGLATGGCPHLSLIHISEPTRPERNSYAVFCLKKKTLPRNDIVPIRLMVPTKI